MNRLAIVGAVERREDVDELKRYALLFDQFVILGYAHIENDPDRADVFAELSFLRDNKLAINTDPFREASQGRTLPDNLRERFRNLARAREQFSNEELARRTTLQEWRGLILKHANEVIRFAAILAHEQGEDAIPLLKSTSRISGFEIDNPANPRRADILRILFTSFPVLKPDTPWERIVEFRADPEARRSLLALRIWTSEVSSGELSAKEIEDKFEYLLRTHEKHLALYKLRATRGVFESLVVGTAEVVENLSRLRFSKVASTLFKVRSQNIELMEAELRAPGAEVAYVSRARSHFAT